jgi:hypothetical protein
MCSEERAGKVRSCILPLSLCMYGENSLCLLGSANIFVSMVSYNVKEASVSPFDGG